MRPRLGLLYDRSTTLPFERIFEPNFVLPSQVSRHLPHHGPTRALAAAVLEQACRDLHSGHAELVSLARQWIRGEFPSALSFAQACDWIGLDADWLRAKILEDPLCKMVAARPAL